MCLVGTVYAGTKVIKKGENTMKDDEIMTAEEFFGELEGAKGAGCAGGLQPRKRRAKNTFEDLKARMVMRIYGVTRAKAERIISERAAENFFRSKRILKFPLEPYVNPRKLFLAYRREFIMRKEIREFIKFVKNYYA